MPSVDALITAYGRSPRRAPHLRALGLALAPALAAPDELPADAVELLDAVDVRGYDQAGTWQQVRAARDFGQLTPTEYDYLAAAVEALTMEDS